MKMNNHYNENINILKSRGFNPPETANVNKSSVEVVESKSGHPVPSVFTGEGKKLFVHSRIDPYREAERMAGESDFRNKDLIVVFGFGFAYHCEAILEKCGKDTFVLAVEKDIALFIKALESRDLRELLQDMRFNIALEPDDDSLTDMLKGKSSRRAAFFTHRGSFQIHPEYYSSISSAVKSFVSTKDVNIATLSKFEKTWVSNIARNIKKIFESPGADIFFNRFKGIPAIVAGAGPSLTESLDFIRDNRHRALIVAVDTSYKILVDNGIVPHFCIAVDPQIINARYLEGAEETSTVLVADPTVHPSLLRFFQGPVVMTGVAFDMMKWVESYLPSRGQLAHGGSVSTNAYDFAKRTGASPVILTGQDLSFTSGLAHARGSYLDEQIFNRGNRLSNPLMVNRKQLTFLPRVMLPGKRGNPVHSNSKMMIFINWFEGRKDPDLINASADGVAFKGIKNADSSNFSFNQISLDIEDTIEKIISSEKGKLYEKNCFGVLKRVEEMLAEIEELIPVLERGVKFAEDLKDMINKGEDRSNPGKTGYIIKKLGEIDLFIESRKKAGPMISVSIQRVIHTITEGYDTGEGNDNAGAKSEFLYRGLLEGAVFNRKILGKMKILLKNQG
jgi:hypothetical protein